MTKTLFRRVHLGALSLTIAASGATTMAQEETPGTKPQAAPEAAPSKQEARFEFVQLETSKGNILLELDRARAPISVRNFMMYVKDGTYNGTIFHRVINGFMIQGGGFSEDMVQKPTKAPIKNEWRNGLKNERGTIAMARTSNPDSATDQFFINLVNNDRLSTAMSGGAGYAVFGKVVSGMDVVDMIKAVPTGQKSGMSNVPVTPIVVKKAVQISPDEAKKIIDKKDKSEG